MDNKLNQIKNLFDQNLGSREIAKQLNITRWAVQQAYKELGIYNIGRTKIRTAHLATEKSCKKCSLTKSVDQFRKRIKGDRISFEVYCLECEKEYNKISCKERYEKNKDGSIKEYQENNKEKIKEYNDQWREENKKWVQQYRIENKEHINNYLKNYNKNKRAHNPEFKLREIVSHNIWYELNKNNCKKTNSCLKNLPYTIEQLKQHLENKFESWMTWENHGRYFKNKWIDSDQSTWTWQLDHIIPCSTLPYTSMEDENFKKSWALENLRPLSAKQNLIDGVRRSRH